MWLFEIIGNLFSRARTAAYMRHMRSDNLRSQLRTSGLGESTTWNISARAADEARRNQPYIMTDSCLGRPVFINDRRCMIRR